MNEDRRKSPRIPITAKVSYVSENKTEIFFTEDLSEGGLFLKAEHPPFVGTVLELSISIPMSEKLIDVTGDVIWRLEGKGCGVRFFKLSAEKKKIIQEYIKEISSSS
ncbi:MAG: PilZ domain-containing protein [Bdellovibrionales bacterium]|nr:PilZ domain-containing protein [Bdellovibrionales bacterium]